MSDASITVIYHAWYVSNCTVLMGKYQYISFSVNFA